MNPYYDHGGITIYHGDCREIVPGLREDHVITDPPYDEKTHNPSKWEARCEGDGWETHVWVTVHEGTCDIGAQVDRDGDATDWHVQLTPWPINTVEMDRTIHVIKDIVEVLLCPARS